MKEHMATDKSSLPFIASLDALLNRCLFPVLQPCHTCAAFGRAAGSAGRIRFANAWESCFEAVVAYVCYEVRGARLTMPFSGLVYGLPSSLNAVLLYASGQSADGRR